MPMKVVVSPVKKCGPDRPTALGKSWIMLGVFALSAALPLIAQNAEMQQKLATVKQSVVENKQRLQHYQWVETTQLTLKGDAKPPSQNLCQYGPGGQVQKTPIGPPPPPPSGGRLKQRIVAKKKAEIKDYIDDVKNLLTLYVPPDPQKMQQAYQAGKLSFNPAPGVLNLIFRDYAQPGDQMTLTFDPAKLTVLGLSINTYMGDEKDAVTLQVQMANLPDGTRYVFQTVLTAKAKDLVATTTSAQFQRLAGY